MGYDDRVFQATQDPWHKVIKCRNGHICPSGDTELWACTKNRLSRMFKWAVANDWLRGKSGDPAELATQIKDELRVTVAAKDVTNLMQNPMPCVVMMEGSDGANIAFDVADHKLFFKLMGALRR